MHPVTKRSLLLIISLVGTFIFLRVSLYISPNSNFDVAGYNIHHLYTGIVVLTLAVIPLLLLKQVGRVIDILITAFGVGLSLVLDEWVYLIATDGSDASYLTPISFWGGVIAIAITVFYIILIALFAKKE
ncbi:hypothetical protein MNBD_GAMMA21-2831 [hydrothermal vent metagenome]|uniref:Uncharacterized protein n=1 Tax=hydrothermal vent metagenome TaxID=652676 RepID=A0A3B0ZER3_9ZZZZ